MGSTTICEFQSASNLRMPLVDVGVLYQEGYFSQIIAAIRTVAVFAMAVTAVIGSLSELVAMN
jgi:glucan phosphorylase